MIIKNNKIKIKFINKNKEECQKNQLVKRFTIDFKKLKLIIFKMLCKIKIIIT